MKTPDGQDVLLPSGTLDDDYLSATAGIHSEFLKWWKASLEYTFEANFSGDQTDIPAAQATQLRKFQRHVILLSTTLHY